MKPKATLLRFLALAASSLMAVSSASATTYWWDSNSTTAGFGNTTGTWGTSAFWSTSSDGTGATANTTITSADTVNFGTATLNYANSTVGVAVGGVTVGGIVMGAGQTTAINLGTSGNAITIHSGGITKNAGSAQLSMVGPIILGAAQTWTNNSSTALTTSNGTNLITNGGFQLTVDGTGTTSFGTLNTTTGVALSGSGALVKNGTGRLEIGNNNTGFTGDITVNGGTLFYGDTVGALGTGNINITNGIIEGRWDSALSRNQGTTGTTIQITGGISGFSNSRNQTFSIGASATWGSSTFNPTEFVLQGSGTGSIKFSTAINLNGADRTIRSDQAAGSGQAEFTGAISGTGGIIKVGTGHQVLTATNSYTGVTTISGGMLTANVLANGGSNSSIGNSSNAASNLVLGNGTTFRYTGGAVSTNRSFTINGTAAGHGASLDASGSGAVNWTNTATPAYGTVDQTRTLTLTGTSTGNNTLAANIANNGTGAVSVNKTGAGLWILSNTSNSYTGGTTLTGGTLSVGAASNLGDASSDLVFNGGTLQITGTSLTSFASLGRTNPITFTSGQTVGLDIAAAGNTFTVDQTLNQGWGGLTKAGAGTLVINSAHTYTGVTTISAGTLRLDSGGSIAGSVINNSIYLVNQNATTGTAPLVNIAGSGSVAAGPSATLTINTPTGLSFNALNTTGGGSFALSGVTAPTFGGLVGTTGNLSSSFSSGYTSGVTSLTLNPQSGSSFTYGGVIDDGATGMTLTKTGVGTQTLTGANTYTGATTINGGTLNLGGGTATGSLASTVLNLGGGTLSYTRTGTNTQAFTTTNVTGGANTVSTTVATNTIAMGSLVRSVGSTLDVSSTGTITTTTANDATGILGGWATITNNNWAVNAGSDITGGATYYTTTTGGTTGSNYNNTRNMDVSGSVTMVGTINPNTIRFNVAAASVVTLAAGDNIVDSGGILITSTVGNNLSTITGGNLAGSAGGDLIIHQHNTSNGLTIGSIIKDNTSATALTKSGAGTLTLSGTNSFSGGVFINGGTLQIASADNLGDSANVVTFAGSGSLKFTSNTTLSQGFVINEGVTAALDAYNYDITINNSLSGSGTLWALNGGDPGRSFNFTSTNNTFTGNIQISNSAGGAYSAGLIMASLADTPGTRIKMSNTGIFTYGAGAVVPLVLNNRQIEHSASNAILNNNATNVNSTVTVNTDLILSGGVGNRPFTLGGSNTGNNTFAGAITNGAGYVTSLTKAGAGTWVLTNANTYTGGTTLTAGNLQVGVDSVGSMGSITSSAVGTGTLTFNGGGISSNGAAARTILNPISFTGNGAVGDATNTGKLTFSADAALGGATRTLTVNSDAEFSGIISSTGAFGMTKAGTGTLILSGANTYSGTTTVNAGLLTLSGSGTLGNGSGGLTMGGGALDLGTLSQSVGAVSVTSAAASGDTIGNGSLTGTSYAASNTTGNAIISANLLVNAAAGFTKTGTGTVTLSGANTYTGTTTLTAGNTQVGVNSVGSVGAITSSALGTGTLTFNGGGISSDGTTARTILNDITFTGNATLGDVTNTGKLTFAANASLGATRTLTVNSTSEFSGIISGATFGITKAGLGDLILSGANSYTGATSINAGTLVLDMASGGSLNSTTALTGTANTSGGTFLVKGASSGSSAQTVGAWSTGNNTAMRIAIDPNGGTGTTLTLGNAWTVGSASSMLIDYSSASTGTRQVITAGATTGTTLSNGLYGRIMVKDSNGVVGFATRAAGTNQAITRFDDTTGTTLVNNSNTSTTNFTTLNTVYTSGTLNWSNAITNRSVNSLTIDTTNNGGIIDMGAATNTLTVTSGGILFKGGNDATLTGGQFTAGYSFHVTGSNTLTVNTPTNGSNLVITKDGTGTLVLGGNSTTTGTIGVNEGTLKLGAAGNGTNTPLGTTGQNTRINTGATLDLGGITLSTAEALTLYGTGVSGNGALTNSGAAATWSGAITLASDASIVSNNNISLTAATSVAGAFNLTLGGTAAGSSITGIIGTTTGGVTKTGTGNWTLSGANTYTGLTRIAGGTLALGHATNTLADTGAVNVDGGTLSIGGNSDTVGSVTLTSGSITGMGGTLTGASYAMQSGSASAILGGTGALTKTTAGTVTLSGANTYTGATTVTAGTLVIASGGSTHASSAVTVSNSGSALVVNGTINGTLNANVSTTVSGNGTVKGAATIAGTLSPGASPGTLTFENTLGLSGATLMEIDGMAGAGLTGGHDAVYLTGTGAAGVLTYGGALTLDIGTTFGVGSYSWDLFDFASESGTFATISLADQYTGSLLDANLDGIWNLTSGNDTWTFTESTGVLGLTVIPEPRAALLGGLGLLVLLRRRRD